MLAALLALAYDLLTPPRHDALAAVPDTLRVLVALGVLFGVTGFGLVRLLLPERLRRYELLWVLPAGGCAAGLALTALGFAYVPYPLALGLVLGGGLALDVLAVRRRGWPTAESRRLAWPVFLAAVVFCVAILPMIAVQHYAAPIGEGSDAHVATGVANFLQHAYPTGLDLHQPINQMPDTWKSKYPIYYAFAGVSTLSGLATWQVIAPLAAALLALAALGLFLVAREVFGAPVAAAVCAMGLAALDRMALHTVIHPYFNQTWGFFALPFTLVLGWELVQPGRSRRSRTVTAALLAIFAAVLVLAYPLAAPIPAVPLIVFALSAWRRRIQAGEPGLRLRDLYRGRRSLLWMIPVAVVFAVPAVGVVEKFQGAISVLEPGHSLATWGGDLQSYIPFDRFFSLPSGPQGAVLAVLVAACAIAGLWRRDRALRLGLGGLLLLGLALALYLRQRAFGFYFHFKLLAFIGPLVMLIAALGAARFRRLGAVALAVLAASTLYSADRELKHNGYQLPPTIIHLSSWAKALPPGSSVLLVMHPALQIWVAYFMDARPLCSPMPLVDTDYPHVPFSVKADYMLVEGDWGRPPQALGPPLRRNAEFVLYRQNPSSAGTSATCSLRRLDRIYPGLGWAPR